MDDDRRGIDQIKAQFEAITQLADSDFKGSLTYGLRMNHYATVYNYATKSVVATVDQNYFRHETLYIDFQEMLTRFMLRFQVDPRWSEMDLFYRIVKCWKQYKVVQQWSLKTFAYISRFYVQHYSKMPLPQVAMSIFLEQLFRKHETLIRSMIFDFVLRERKREASDREIVQCAIEMYSAMGIDGLNTIYTDNFLKPFVAASSDFYRKESVSWAQTDTATEYLMKAEQRLLEEKARCLKYFTMEEEKRVMESVESALLDTEVAKNVLFRSPTGFSSVVERRDVANLRRYYKMFAHIPSGLEAMAAAMKECIIVEGSEKSKQHSGPEKSINCKDCVSDLVNLQEDFISLLQQCFSSNPVLMKAIREGFERIFNNGIVATDAEGKSIVVSFSELLANYCDMLLRQPNADEHVTETQFDQIVSVLRYVSDSDNFQLHARELLAKRLLAQTTKPNEGLERLLLSRLKQRCGAHFTTQFEGMMNDRITSVELCERFQSATESNPLPFDFQCMILKTGIWPKFPIEDGVHVPPEFQSVMTRFAAFHNEEAKHRVLKWSHSTSYVTVNARFKGNAIKEFQLSAFQSWVLLYYNTSGSATLQSLTEALGIEVDELKRILMSYAKVRVLLRSSEGSIQPLEPFTLNVEYSSAHRKMHIPLLTSRITVSGTAKATQQIEEDRKPTIDACIVRLMKSRREMTHQDLMAECIAQLSQRFSPDPKLIKLRIEDLIKREYIERAAENNNLYRYLA